MAMMTVEEARAAVLEHSRPVGVERVMLDDALYRVLAEDVVGASDWPRFDNSSMDGYAVCWPQEGDTSPLRVVDYVVAGRVASRAIGRPCMSNSFCRTCRGKTIMTPEALKCNEICGTVP